MQRTSRHAVLAALLLALSTSAVAPLPQPRFSFPAGGTVTVTGTLSATADADPHPDWNPQGGHGHQQTSLSALFPLGPTGVVASDDASVSATAATHKMGLCAFYSSAVATSALVWQLAARPAQITFAAASHDLGHHNITGGGEGDEGSLGELFPADTTTEQEIASEPLILEVPFELQAPANLVVRSLTARRLRDYQCTFDAMDADAGGLTSLCCLVHLDTDGDGHPDGPSAFTAYVGAGDGAIESAPVSSVELDAGCYVLVLWHARWTGQHVLENVCASEALCEANVDDHVRVVVELE